jgi:ribosome-associated protein
MRDLFVSPHLTIPAGELSLAFSRSGGPGGQNVNKVASKVELRWNVVRSVAISYGDRAWLLGQLRNRLTQDGDLVVTSTTTRDQLQNREDAADKLVQIVRAALHRPTPRRPTKPSRGSKRRRLEGKRRHAEIKQGRRSVDR